MPRSYNPLADFVIGLADPRNLRTYRQDPSAYLQRFGVSAADRTAIASGSANVIRQRAARLGNVATRPGRGPTPSSILEISEISEISGIRALRDKGNQRDPGDLRR